LKHVQNISKPQKPQEPVPDDPTPKKLGDDFHSLEPANFSLFRKVAMDAVEDLK
jgi:hypothetical protein